MKRMQPLRKNASIRALLLETVLTPNDFILPVFVNESLEDKKAVDALPGLYQHSLSSLQKELQDAIDVGIKAVMIFGVPIEKTGCMTHAFRPDGIVQKSIALCKKQFPELYVIADCCLCQYQPNQQCQILNVEQSEPDIEATQAMLNKIALSYAHAGVDCVAPSGMLDGMIAGLRATLTQSGFSQLSLMSYAIKYASAFYGPFREATGGDVPNMDRKYHQLDPAQQKEALLEAQLDEKEGADFLLVKPASSYLDVVQCLSQQTQLPIVTYHVSAEYAMIKLAAQQGIIDEVAAFTEVYTSLKRAGASLIVSYYAKELCKGVRLYAS